jgi:hypothetical protein
MRETADTGQLNSAPSARTVGLWGVAHYAPR